MSRASGIRTRKHRATGRPDDAPARDEANVDKAVTLHAGADRRRQWEPAKPHVPGTLAAQLIAQKMPGKSERRLARYFPDRVHRAYQQTARGTSAVHTQRSA